MTQRGQWTRGPRAHVVLLRLRLCRRPLGLNRACRQADRESRRRLGLTVRAIRGGG
jgi:hypothetical protein